MKYKGREKEYMKEYRKTHKERLKELYTNYRKKHKKRLDEYGKKWRRDNPARTWNYNLKRDFGLTSKEYEKMLEEQNGCCAICGGSDGGGNQHGKKRLSIDHNHITGKIRGILCGNCNTALGYLKVDKVGVKLLKFAISYIRRTDK